MERYGTRELTAKEMQVVYAVARGLTNAQIGEELGSTETTIKNSLRVIFDKLGCWNRVEVALWWEKRLAEKQAEHVA